MRDTGKESHSRWPSFPRPSFSPVASASSNPSSLPFFPLLLFHTLSLGSLFGVPSSWALHQGPLKGHRASSQPLILADFSCTDLSSVTWENPEGTKARSTRRGGRQLACGFWGYREATHPAGTLEREEKRDTWLWKGGGGISGTPLPQPLQVEV